MTFTPALLATHRAFTSTPALFGLVADRSGAKGEEAPGFPLSNSQHPGGG